MTFRSKVSGVRFSPIGGGKFLLTAITDGAVQEIPDGSDLTIGTPKKKRSLTANAYYQVLLDKVSAVLNTDRKFIHEQLLIDYGVTKELNDRPVIFSLREDIDGHEICKYCEVIGTGTVNGKTFRHWRAVKGSSEMDSKEFSRLLDGLITECKELGIETMTKGELAKLEGYEI